jgi:hypothetical protein
MKINTNTLLIAGAAAVGIYLLTRPRVASNVNPATGLPYGYPTTAYPGYNPALANQGNNPAAIISAGGTALESLSDLLGNFF